jgi:hypothetical protein
VPGMHARDDITMMKPKTFELENSLHGRYMEESKGRQVFLMPP